MASCLFYAGVSAPSCKMLWGRALHCPPPTIYSDTDAYTQVEEVSGVLQHSLCQLPMSVERVAEGAPQTAVDHLVHTASKHLYTRRG